MDAMRARHWVAALLLPIALTLAPWGCAARDGTPLDPEAFWRAVFDAAAPQPAAEGELFSVVKTARGVVLPEVRGEALRIEGVRILYGTPMVSYVGPTEASGRVAERVNARSWKRWPRWCATSTWSRSSFGAAAPSTSSTFGSGLAGVEGSGQRAGPDRAAQHPGVAEYI